MLTREAMVLLLVACLAAFTYIHRGEIRAIRHVRPLLVSIGAAMAAWSLGSFQTLVWPSLFNSLEHASYAVSSIALLLWCVRHATPEKL